MALVVFLRAVNVGGHNTFRPSALARELSDYDVVNVGAAGTFVVRKPGALSKFRAELFRRLPVDADVMICDGRDLLNLEIEDPFGNEPVRPEIVRFVSVLSKAVGDLPTIPHVLPLEGDWLLRILRTDKKFIFGVYRRHMKAISYLGKIEKMLGVPVTTRSWNTIVAINRILKGERQEDAGLGK